MRAILVEDNDLLAEQTRLMVEHLGYRIERNDSLRDGMDVLLRLAAAPPPDLLIIDVFLPGPIDGVDVLCAVREARLPGVCPGIVVVSGIYAPGGSVAAMVERNRAVFLPKPYDGAELAEAIRAARGLADEWDTLEEIETFPEDLPAPLYRSGLSCSVRPGHDRSPASRKS